MRNFLFLLLSVPSVLMAQERKPFTINGQFKGLADNTEISIRNEDISPDPLVKGLSKGGKFQLNGTLPEANLYYLAMEGSQQRLYFFLEPSNIRIEGHKDSLMKATVSGSKSNEVFVEFNRRFNPAFGKLQQLAQKINAGQSTPGDATRREYEALVMDLQKNTDQFVAANAGSPVAPFSIMVMTQLTEDIMVTERRYEMLKPEAKASYFGRMVNQQVIDGKVGAVGTDAIDFIQNDTTGKPVSLSSFKGKYVLVDFWASWCKPCRMENPNVVEAYKKYAGKNFTVLGVSLDRARDPWIQAIKDDELTWTHVSDLKFWNNEAAAKYKISSIPQNFLIGPDGKIIAKNLRGEELQTRLAVLLK